MNTAIQNRYEFVMFFDVENGNPNGDPDFGNMPRIDPEAGFGIVTDVCLKRKIRNYVELIKEDGPGYQIYIKESVLLNNQHERAYKSLDELPKKLEKKKPDAETLAKVRKWMCLNFYDVRTFGAVMSTDINCGQVRGPVQLNFARSVDPIAQQDITISRIAITNTKDEDKSSTFGRKYIIPYALYRAEGYVSAKLSNDQKKGTGFSEDDLSLLWDALVNMFEHDHSAARGKMCTRKLVIFRHASELGNAPAHKLFERVTVERLNPGQPARSFADYGIQIDKGDLPEGVSIIERE